ncbi:MAG TPA: NAD-dependent malic enzyme [Vicinamibacteria bacterium]|nr:NAD-dependent malic enzyme [Vicinamibacteria bacterium]
MEPYRHTRGPDGRVRVSVPWRGAALLAHPMYNKSTAFTLEERAAFGLAGLLPAAVSTMEQQAERAYGNIARKTDALERYIGLAALQDRNEHLFYRVLLDHLEDLVPIVYTPTVGRACQEFSRIFRRARGLWITPGDQGRVYEALGNAPWEDVRLIVVTDNQSILGLGDQGAGGMPIPVGKLALYTAAAGIHPARTLPVSLDVGTDNPALLRDDLYLGWRHPRVHGERYEALVEEFVQAVRRRFPRAVLQWEDFSKGNAFALLERYRGVLPSFNDDIQGTAAVALAGVLAAGRASGTALPAQRIVILGAGAAGVGIGRLLRDALQRAGVTGSALTEAIAVLDSHGLVREGPGGAADAYRRALAWPAALAERRGLGADAPRDLAAVVRQLRPTVLIGVSGAPGAFSEAIVRDMARHVERPVIFPMSNPTSQAEAMPADVLAWTGGRALVATGSPFPAVAGRAGPIRIGQGNNAFIFPGLGLGALVAQAREITEGMFTAAASRLAELVRPEDLAAGSLFPPIADLRPVTAEIAVAVAREARDGGVGRHLDDADLPKAVRGSMWEPVYPVLEPVPVPSPELP